MGMVAGAGLVVLLLKELFALIFIDFLFVSILKTSRYQR